MTRAWLIFPAFATVLLVTTATATPDDAGQRIAECADVKDDARRLQCYDRALAGGKSRAKPEAGEEVTAPASPVTPTPSTGSVPIPDADEAAPERFGLDAEREANRRQAEPDQISARITGLEFQRYGERVFTLDNGQVWVEKSPNAGLRLRVGDSVTIKRGLFRSYKLFGSGNKSSAVDRVR